MGLAWARWAQQDFAPTLVRSCLDCSHSLWVGTTRHKGFIGLAFNGPRRCHAMALPPIWPFIIPKFPTLDAVATGFLFFSSYFNYSTKSGWWMWRLIMWWMIYDLGWVQPTMSKPVLWWVTVESGGLLMNFWPCAVPWLHSLVPKCLWSMHVPIYTPLPPASLSLIVPNRSSLSFFFCQDLL